MAINFINLKELLESLIFVISFQWLLNVKNSGIQLGYHVIVVGEPKSRIVQKHTFFAPERYTAGILYYDSL